jgi:hypothetical protein
MQRSRGEVKGYAKRERRRRWHVNKFPVWDLSGTKTFPQTSERRALAWAAWPWPFLLDQF